MQLKQLEVFVQVAKLKSFSRAAEALYLTQPTVSAHLAALEDDLGVKVVMRSTRSVALTPAGQVLYNYAAQILGLCERAEREVRSAASEVRGALPIAASTVPSQYLLPRVLARFRVRWPRVFFQVYQGDSALVVQRLMEGSAELGIVGAPVDKPGCECVPFLTERLVIATANTPEYQALGGVMPYEVLRAGPFLVREPGSGTRRQGDEFLRGIGLDPRRLELSAQLESTESILQAVKNGLGIAIVSGLAAEEYAAAGSILAFDYNSPLLEREFYLVYHKNRMLTPAARTFLRELPCYYGGGGPEDCGEAELLEN